MSALLPSDRGTWHAPTTDLCFYCSETVPPDLAAVNWMGAEHILLHADCAQQLGCNLIMDSRETRLASGEEPWLRRALRAIREALVAQEREVRA